MLKKTHQFPQTVHCSALAPVSLRPSLLNTQSALIGRLTHAWDSSANNSRAAVLKKLLLANLAANHKLSKRLTRWRSVMSHSPKIKGGTTEEAFQEQWFLSERGASVSADFKIFYRYKSRYKTLREKTKKRKKPNMSPLNRMSCGFFVLQKIWQTSLMST